MKIKTLEETLETLSSNDFLYKNTNDEITNILCSFGLNGENSNELPIRNQDYYNKGIRIWQSMVQFVPFLKWLCEINVNSYLEIGCRWGGTFIVISEILKNNNKDIKTFACDIIEKTYILDEYSKYRNFVYIHEYSNSEKFKNEYTDNMEMVFIDGDHSYDVAKGDYELFKNKKETKYIIFHDIDSVSCPDVVRLWNEIKNDENFNYLEFKDQYPEVGRPYMGIGVLIRK